MKKVKDPIDWGKWKDYRIQEVDDLKEDIYMRVADDDGDTKIIDEIMKHWKAVGASIDKLSKKNPKVAKELKKAWQTFGRTTLGI